MILMWFYYLLRFYSSASLFGNLTMSFGTLIPCRVRTSFNLVNSDHGNIITLSGIQEVTLGGPDAVSRESVFSAST